jgi:uncharacterized protein (TIGR02145 family)
MNKPLTDAIRLRYLASILFLAFAYQNGAAAGRNCSLHTTGLQDTLVVDRDGNEYPVKTMSDGRLWMTANLSINEPDSYCYDDVQENCTRFGRLYLWQSAVKVCETLGTEWQLPTSDEWRKLASSYRGAAADSNNSRKLAYQLLLISGTSGFKAVLGGGRDHQGTFARGDAHGFYWTATQIDSHYAWFYNFAKGSQALYQQDGGEKTRAFSVRCIKKME